MSATLTSKDMEGRPVRFYDRMSVAVSVTVSGCDVFMRQDPADIIIVSHQQARAIARHILKTVPKAKGKTT